MTHDHHRNDELEERTDDDDPAQRLRPACVLRIPTERELQAAAEEVAALRAAPP